MSARSWLQLKFARTRLTADLFPGFLNGAWGEAAGADRMIQDSSAFNQAKASIV